MALNTAFLNIEIFGLLTQGVYEVIGLKPLLQISDDEPHTCFSLIRCIRLKKSILALKALYLGVGIDNKPFFRSGI